MNSLFTKYINSKSPISEIKIPKFGDIITEQNKTSKSSINIVMLSIKNPDDGNKDDSNRWTINRIRSYCEKHNIPKYVAYIGSAYTTKENGTLKIHNIDDEQGFALDPNNTIVIIRGGSRIIKSNVMKDTIALIQRHNIFCINNLDTIENCGDKYRTYLKLTEAGIPCPKSAVVHSEEMIPNALEKIGGNFPIVVKLLSGSKGIGVFIVDSQKSLTSTLQVMWKLDPNAELLMQEFIDAEGDIRVHVLGDQCIAAMKRYTIKDDFRSNFSLGSEIEAIELDDKIKKLCIHASKIIGGMWVGADLILSKKDKKPYFLEINSSPGTFGIEKALKKDIISIIMNYLINPDNWVKVPQICGFQEMININGIDSPISAKFDTGNGATCALHADNININDNKKTVSWTYNGIEFKDKPYNRKIRLIKGAIGGTEVKKITVLFDIIFNGTVYKNVEFALDDRENKITPVLLSRKFMNDANIIVNPARAFLLTLNPQDTPIKNDVKPTEIASEGKNGR